jgi:hypothetical protein
MSANSKLLQNLFALNVPEAVVSGPKALKGALSQLLSPCLFGHGDLVRTRDDQGFLTLQCADCGHASRVLLEPAIKGPRHVPVPVKGAPLATAKRVAAPKRSFPRSA